MTRGSNQAPKNAPPQKEPTSRSLPLRQAVAFTEDYDWGRRTEVNSFFRVLFSDSILSNILVQSLSLTQ